MSFVPQSGQSQVFFLITTGRLLPQFGQKAKLIPFVPQLPQSQVAGTSGSGFFFPQ